MLIEMLISAGEHTPYSSASIHRPVDQSSLLVFDRYPSAVATLSRRCRDRIEEAFDKSVEGGRDSPLLGSRLHDFGFRGCTGVEQSAFPELKEFQARVSTEALC